MGDYWNDRGKAKYMEKSPSQCHFVHQKSHMDWPGSNPSLLGVMQATNCLSHDMLQWWKSNIKVPCCSEHRNVVHNWHLKLISTGKRKTERKSSSYTRSNIMMFWDVGPCSWVVRYQQFR
jgi:hypothetical protein